MKASELSDILEVDERMIRKYAKDIDLSGIPINSIQGPYGGYELEGGDYLINLNLTKAESFVLNLAKEELKSINFVYNKEFEFAIDKINASLKVQNEKFNKIDYLIKQSQSLNVAEERKICFDINSSIISRRKIKIKYFSLNSEKTSIRIIHPYAVISYKSAFYVVAYCEKRNNIIDFKVSRIKEYDVLNDEYKIPDDFSLKKYMKDSFGIYRDEKIDLKLLIYKPMSYIISEKLWVNNQKIIWNDDKSIIFEASMGGKTEIKSWILSMGQKVKVLAPESLKNEIKDETKKTLENY